MRLLLVLISLLLSQTAFAVESFPAPGRKDARVYIPDQYNKSIAWPAIVLLHGYFGNDSVIDSYFGFSKEVNKRGFILIVPNGKSDSGGIQFGTRPTPAATSTIAVSMTWAISKVF